ncbi:RecX family transcriptional regulator [Candidatus Saccharibacteria bacterium]|nr:RecX family transcriptional regulator [Candidatus Saccharibacteria bacterium]
MEIYKLGGDQSSNITLEITDMRQAVKNKNRVNVFVNQKYSFSLDVAQLVDLKLKVGAKISEAELAEYKKLSEFGKLYQRTLEWVLARPRSEKEAFDYLYKKIYEKKLDKNYINSIIERLKNKKYLDDERFAKYYVENRFVKKGVSRRRLEMELMKKGIKKEIIEKVLSDSVRSDEEEILKIIAKKRARYDDEKLTQYLCRQGFSYELVQNLVRTYGKD